MTLCPLPAQGPPLFLPWGLGASSPGSQGQGGSQLHNPQGDLFPSVQAVPAFQWRPRQVEAPCLGRAGQRCSDLDGLA